MLSHASTRWRTWRRLGKHWINDDFILSNIFDIIRDFMGRPYAINVSVILNIPSFTPRLPPPPLLLQNAHIASIYYVYLLKCDLKSKLVKWTTAAVTCNWDVKETKQSKYTTLPLRIVVCVNVKVWKKQNAVETQVCWSVQLLDRSTYISKKSDLINFITRHTDGLRFWEPFSA